MIPVIDHDPSYFVIPVLIMIPVPFMNPVIDHDSGPVFLMIPIPVIDHDFGPVSLMIPIPVIDHDPNSFDDFGHLSRS